MDITEKQKRIEEAENFFNQLYGKIIALHFSYLITFKDRIETYSFAINNETGRRNMAIKAIELGTLLILSASNPLTSNMATNN